MVESRRCRQTKEFYASPGTSTSIITKDDYKWGLIIMDQYYQLIYEGITCSIYYQQHICYTILADPEQVDQYFYTAAEERELKITALGI